MSNLRTIQISGAPDATQRAALNEVGRCDSRRQPRVVESSDDRPQRARPHVGRRTLLTILSAAPILLGLTACEDRSASRAAEETAETDGAEPAAGTGATPAEAGEFDPSLPGLHLTDFPAPAPPLRLLPDGADALPPAPPATYATSQEIVELAVPGHGVGLALHCTLTLPAVASEPGDGSTATGEGGGAEAEGASATTPDPRPWPAVVLIEEDPQTHPYAGLLAASVSLTLGRAASPYDALALSMAARGFAVLVVPPRFHAAYTLSMERGDSRDAAGAAQRAISFNDLVDDACAATTALARRDDIDGARLFLAGHGSGGFVALAAARRLLAVDERTSEPDASDTTDSDGADTADADPDPDAVAKPGLAGVMLWQMPAGPLDELLLDDLDRQLEFAAWTRGAGEERSAAELRIASKRTTLREWFAGVFDPGALPHAPAPSVRLRELIGQHVRGTGYWRHLLTVSAGVRLDMERVGERVPFLVVHGLQDVTVLADHALALDPARLQGALAAASRVALFRELNRNLWSDTLDLGLDETDTPDVEIAALLANVAAETIAAWMAGVCGVAQDGIADEGAAGDGS